MMKQTYIKIIVGAILMLMFLVGCEDILEEKPRSIFTPEFFKTEEGVQGGLTALYAHLRQFYGQGYYYNAHVTGTDEAAYGESADQNFKIHDMSGQGDLTSQSSNTNVLWDAAFPNINTASGIIENAAEVGISEALIAEARFFRAFDYFLLVQTFGGVPLDLGAGNLKFNSTPIRNSVRNTVPEVYTIGIFPDLLTAVNDLPDEPRLTGTATKTLARLYLSRAYLTYAWWLENPNNIPTYPPAERVDPDGHNAQWYFQQAYDVATEAIDNPGPFGLQPSFYELHLGENDRNMEELLYADHTEFSEYYNDQGAYDYSSGEGHHNFAEWMMTWNYTYITSQTSTGQSVSSVVREAVQDKGRPWIRMCPTLNVFSETFAEKTNDSRYDGTFVTVYRGNWDKDPENTNASLFNANGLEVFPGDPILSFLKEEPATPIEYPVNDEGRAIAGPGGVGAGTLAGRADYVIGPTGFSRIVYPGFWKWGTYRTDNEGGFGQPNGGITRPYKIARFAELYFVAAEAAVKGATTAPGKSARDLINVIRARAGNWVFDREANVPKLEDHSAEMMAATPATIDLDYLLLEKSREFYAEGHRWFDLVRTQKWAEYAATYQICKPAYGEHTPETFTRTIEPYHYLRPIPQGQIDGLDMTDEEKDAYQNPGYQ
jgi:hypothetical protein